MIRNLLTFSALCLISCVSLSLPALAESAEKWNGSTRNYNVRPSAPTKTRIITSENVSPVLSADSPRLLLNAIARYEIIASRGGWQPLPRTRTLVPGSRGKIVRLLKARLAMEGYLSDSSGKKYNKKVQRAVYRFQLAHGLYAHGRIDTATWHALNVPAEVRLEALRANLPRATEYVKGLSARYVVVNIPATQLDVVENGRVYSRHNVVVGKPDRPSPILKSKVAELNFHPYWNAPVSIVKKDIIPQVRKNRRILKKLKIKIYDGYGGPEVDPATIDWNNLDPKRYHFRQEPGKGNAMASVKINFANKYAVYMHDTPTKQLFSQGSRYFSSGCVRIDKVHIVTDWILRGQGDWNRKKINSVVKAGERLDVKVQSRPQVLFVYLTAWATADGIVHFRNDIYNLDGTGFVTGQPEAS